VSRARARFFRGQVPLLVYTGRAQFFFRHKLRGARHLVLYGLPEGCGQLYCELVRVESWILLLLFPLLINLT